MASGNNFGGGQPRQFQQPRNMTGDMAGQPGIGRPQVDRAAQMQQRRNQLYAQRQAPQNLYDGGGANHISAVMGSNLGQGDPNKGYILHDFGGGKYGYNQGNLDPTMQYLTGDFSKWFK